MSNGTLRVIRNKCQGRGRQKQTMRCRVAIEIVEDLLDALNAPQKRRHLPASGHERPNVIGWISDVIGVVANRVQWLTASLLGARVCYATRPVRSYRLCNSDLWTKRNPVAETCKLNVRRILCSFWYGCHHWTLDVLVDILNIISWTRFDDSCIAPKSVSELQWFMHVQQKLRSEIYREFQR